MNVRIMCIEHLSARESLTFSVDSRETFETLVDLERYAFSNALRFGGMHFAVELPTKDGSFYEVTNGYRHVKHITRQDVNRNSVMKVLARQASLEESQRVYTELMLGQPAMAA
jgi:hypothetical protein